MILIGFNMWHASDQSKYGGTYIICLPHVGQAVPKLKSPSESAPKSSDSEQLTGHEQVTSRNPAERCSEEEKKEDMQGKEEWSG